MKTLVIISTLILTSAMANAQTVCTATGGSLPGGVSTIELTSKKYSFRGSTGIQFSPVEPNSATASVSIVVLDGSNDVNVILRDKATWQQSGFVGGFTADGKLEATLIVHSLDSKSDVFAQVECQK